MLEKRKNQQKRKKLKRKKLEKVKKKRDNKSIKRYQTHLKKMI